MMASIPLERVQACIQHHQPPEGNLCRVLSGNQAREHFAANTGGGALRAHFGL